MNHAVENKVLEVSNLILHLEQEIAEHEMNCNDVDSIRNKVLNLKRKVGFLREVLKNSSSSPYNYNNLC